jgi:hypothetical protein
MTTAQIPPARVAADPAQPAASSSGPPLRAALATIVAASAAPYGYTISIWSAGAVLMRVHGLPSVGAVFAFVGGVVIGFGLMGALARGALTRMECLDHPGDRVLAGSMNWFAVGAAVGAVALIAELDSVAAWPLGAFAATTIYLLCASAQLAFTSAWRRSR